MILQLGNFEIHEYDPNDKEQRHLKYILNEDKDFLKFVTKNLNERLQENRLQKVSEIQFNRSYFVKYKEDFVGYIRLNEVSGGGEGYIRNTICYFSRIS